MTGLNLVAEEGRRVDHRRITPGVPGSGGQREDIVITSEQRGYPGFPGKIGRTREESEPHWNLPVRPPPGSPNIVIVLMDDMGWADIGCYGSEIATPNIDALAGRGIRFSHYTTHPICSPARAALADRDQCPFGGDRMAGQQQSGLPGLFRGHPARRADDRRNPARGRIRDRRGRQVAQFDGWCRAQPHLADPSRLRPFLWVSRGRDRVFLSGAHRLQQHRRADRRLSRGLLRDRRLDGQGDRLRHRDPQPGPERGRSFSTSPTMPCTGRCKPRKQIWRNTAAGTMPAGTRSAPRAFERQMAMGFVPPGTPACGA